MSPNGRNTDLKCQARVQRIAQRQHGNITHRQLLDAGLTPSAVKRWVARGLFHRVHHGVYSLGRPAQTALERAAAAVLACGDGALLSHRAALALWDLCEWPRMMHVTVPGNRRRPGIIVHRCSTLTRKDVRRHQGIRVTSLARALLDSALFLSSKALTRTINDALRTPHLRRGQLAALIDRCPTHPGAKLLRPHAYTHQQPTRSPLEDDFLTFCARHNLPTPEVNTYVCGREADAYFPEQRLIVELDSWYFHSDRESFERDRLNDTEALAQGITTARLTWERIHADPPREARRLDAILRARAA